MKYKLIWLLAMLVQVAAAQHIEQLDEQELNACITPKAVAWNFVMAVVERDYDKMESLMTEEFRDYARSELVAIDENNPDYVPPKTYDRWFSPRYMREFVDMRPLLRDDYHLVIVGTYTGKINGNSEYEGSDGISISFNCADSQGNLYSGERRSTVRIGLVSVAEQWRVCMFR